MAAGWVELETEPPDLEEKVLLGVLSVFVAEGESGEPDDPGDEGFGVDDVM